MSTHKPVLQKEILEFLQDTKIEVFVDGTLGMGGHAKGILKAHPEITTYIGLDQDEEMVMTAKKELTEFQDKVRFVHGNFAHIEEHLDEQGISFIDGALLDIGLSSPQIDVGARGFSFSKEGPLDMRMDRENRLTAEEVVNKFPEKKLGEIFRDLGEEPRWRAAAKAIIQAREKKRIKTTLDLVNILKTVVRGKKHLHPATLVFQALRIYVNDELKALQRGVTGAIGRLRDKGLIGVISFHRLEDRIVKQIFKGDKRIKALTKKPVVPTSSEVRDNPRSRSSKLRFARREV